MANMSVSRNAGTDLTALLIRIKNVPLVIPLFVAMLFFLINGTHFWGAYWEEGTAQVYILMLTFALVVSYGAGYKHLWVSKTKLGDGLANFWIGFIGGWALLLIANEYLFGGNLAGTISRGAIYPSIVLTVLFVAVVEETIFRGVLKEALKEWKLYIIPLALIISSASFAVFHFGAPGYEGQAQPIWFAFLMGLVLYGVTEIPMGKEKREDGTTVRKKLGVPGSTGFHTAFNLFVIGILPLILSGGFA